MERKTLREMREDEEGQAPDLRGERGVLCTLIAAARQDQIDARAEWHDRGRCSGTIPALIGPREIELSAQLATFDAAHPEIAAEITAERAADVARFHEID
jgi:hypothetical protein